MHRQRAPLYKTENIHYSYKLGALDVHALKGVSVEIPYESLVCLTGPSGSGKSTLLSILGLIEPVQKGFIYFDDQDFGALSEKEKNRIRRFDIGFIFQRFHLLPVLTAKENIEFFLGRQGIPKAEREERALEALQAVGLYEQRNKKPLAMSGGQQQRVAIARALVKNPKVIIADEPTASLDQETGRDIMELLHRLCHEKGMTVIVASHDPMVINFADQRFNIINGEIV